MARPPSRPYTDRPKFEHRGDTVRRRASLIVGLALIIAVAAVGVGAPAASAAGAAVWIGRAGTYEGNSGPNHFITFTVALTQPVASDVTVQYKLVPGTASSTDFDDKGGAVQSLTFTAGGATSKTISVGVKPDTIQEPNETFTVKLLSATGATIATPSAVGTIFDDDPSSGVKLTVSNAAIPEGNSGPSHSGTFWVQLSQPSTSTVTVHAMTGNASAAAGSDYQPTMADLTFNPGEVRKAFTVRVTPDTRVETDETFNVQLSDAMGATIAHGSGVGTILDEEKMPNVSTSAFTIGPFNLAPMGQTGWENQSITSTVGRPSGAIGIKGMHFDVVDANTGQLVPMSDVHLHHVVLLDHSRTDAVCPSLSFNRFVASGSERTPLSLGGDYAYRVGANDTWGALWHIMNMSNVARKVYIKYWVDYVPASDPQAALGVTTYWYDVAGCWGNSEFNVPGGGNPAVYTLSRTYTAPKNGTRVAVGGHFHAGGMDITLTRDSDSSVVCKDNAVYGSGMMMDMLDAITPCGNSTSVTAGEQFTTTVRYDNSQAISGAMGIQLSYVYEP
jgi:hypothetical protein